MRSFSWKRSSSAYLFLFCFSNLLFSDVIWLVVKEEVKRLLTREQPVGNLVMMLLCFGDLPGSDIWGAIFPPIKKRPSQTPMFRHTSDQCMPNQGTVTETHNERARKAQGMDSQGTESKGQTAVGQRTDAQGKDNLGTDGQDCDCGDLNSVKIRNWATLRASFSSPTLSRLTSDNVISSIWVSPGYASLPRWTVFYFISLSLLWCGGQQVLVR